MPLLGVWAQRPMVTLFFPELSPIGLTLGLGESQGEGPGFKV